MDSKDMIRVVDLAVKGAVFEFLEDRKKAGVEGVGLKEVEEVTRDTIELLQRVGLVSKNPIN